MMAGKAVLIKEVLHNFVSGGAAISVLARQLGAQLDVVDLGTVTPMLELAGDRIAGLLRGFRWLKPCKPVDRDQQKAAGERQQQLTKPAGSLGQLEALAVQLAGLQGRIKPRVDQVWIGIFAGDHGIVAEGVSAYPQAVTGQMLHNFVSGGAAISVLARQLGAQLDVVLGTGNGEPAGTETRQRAANRSLGADMNGSRDLARRA